MSSQTAARFRQYIRNHHRSASMRFLANIAQKFLRAYFNEGFYEFDVNGERFLIETFSSWWGPRPSIVWDVGANDGQWATVAHHALPAASIHSFEIVPPIADKFEAELSDADWSFLHRLGLSDSEGDTTVTWNRNCDTTSAINIRETGVPGGDHVSIICTVSTIDAQIGRGLPAPDLLKIDTEGHEQAVLEGGVTLLSSDDAPALIQFEYGETWLPSRANLASTQRLLESCGYAVGRLYPDHVEFKPYAYRDDHFRMGNMVAARSPELIRALGMAASTPNRISRSQFATKA